MADTHHPPNWIQRLCAILNVHGWLEGNFPPQVVRFFTAWSRAEGGTASWNPLNSTAHVKSGRWDWVGAYSWQSVDDYNTTAHVANYKRPVDGVMATAATLFNGNYNKLVGALQGALDSGITAEQLVRDHAGEIRTWGTNPDTILNVLKDIQ